MTVKLPGYLIKGILIDLALLVLAYLAIAAWSYDGKCGEWASESATYPCSFAGHLKDLAIVLVILLTMSPRLALLLLPILSLPLLLCYLMER